MSLDPDAVRELWSRTYNTHGKPDWSHLFPHYHDDVVFQDSIQRVEGREAFEALCLRLAKRCRELRMHIVDVSQTGKVIFLDGDDADVPALPQLDPLWLYQADRGRRRPDQTPARLLRPVGATSSTTIPRFAKVYRRFMRRRFG